MSMNRPGPHDAFVVMTGVFAARDAPACSGQRHAVSVAPRAGPRGVSDDRGGDTRALVAGLVVLGIEIGSDGRGTT